MTTRKSDAVYAELRRRIMVAEMPPNSFVDEKHLMEDLEVGRTPLREAVLRLEQEGLAVSMGRRGYVVTGATPADLMRGYELRRELECFTAGLAAERRGEADLAAFDAFLARVEAGIAAEISDVGWHLGVDEEFHLMVAKASDNRFAEKYIAFLYGLSVRSLYVAQVPITTVDEEVEAYRAVLAAIRAQDCAAARREMGRHLTVNPLQALGDKIASLRQRGAP